MRPDASLRRPAIAATLLLPTVAVGLTLAPATLPAQDQPGPGAVVRAPNLPPGTVIGHVTCSDTNGPARFASVFLQPVVSPKVATDRDRPDSSGPGLVNKVVQTGLDGSFTLTNVAPGDYYILADASGYRSAAGVLTREQMDHPTEAQAKLIAQLLTPVSVASNRTSTAEVRLLRGAAPRRHRPLRRRHALCRRQPEDLAQER